MSRALPKSSSNPFKAPLLYKTITCSTMEDARQALTGGAVSGTVCQAGHQTRGRGRFPQRHWRDAPGDSLLFTLILDKNLLRPGPPLTQLLALALCRRLEKAYGLAPRIKWPNDVLVAGRKIGGILVEVESSFFLAGTGVNLRQKSFPEDLRTPGTSLFLEKSEAPDPQEELPELLKEIHTLLAAPSLHESLDRRLEGRGREITLLLGDPLRKNQLKGTVEGLSPHGALRIKDSRDKEHLIYSGEIVQET